MYQVKQPNVASAKDAVIHIMMMQSEAIVEDGKLRCALQALEFYANGGQDGGAKARTGVQLAK